MILKGDIRDYSKSNLRIVAILRKAIMETEYTEITYLARKVEWDLLRFPPEFDKEKSLIIPLKSCFVSRIFLRKRRLVPCKYTGADRLIIAGDLVIQTP